MIDRRHQRVEVASYWKRKHPVPNIYSGSTPIESPLLPNLSFRATDLFWDFILLLDTVVPSVRQGGGVYERPIMTATTATERLGISILRTRLGASLQKHRLQRGLTQAELAEFADLSLKYVGEIERGEANTTLEKLEHLAAAVGWNPMEALEGLREPLSEGVRVLLLDEVGQILDRLKNMTKWLQALDPALQNQARPPRPGSGVVDAVLEGEQRRLRTTGRPSRKTRRTH